MILDKIFNSYKIKYKEISNLLSSEDLTIKKGCTVNVYINLDSILRDISKVNVEKELRVVNDHDRLLFNMMSNIINLAAHYRDYYTKSGVYSRIIMYTTYPFNRLKLKSFYSKDYKKDFFKRINSSDNFIVRSLYEEAIPMCKTIMEYIEDCSIITTNRCDVSLVPYICEREGNISSEYNFIVTKDKYDFQYVNNDFIILRPKKDSDYLVYRNNLIDTLKREHRISNPKEISPSFFTFIYSILGDDIRNIPKIKRVGLSAIIDMLTEAQKIGLIGKENMSIYILAKTLNNEFKETVLGNYSCVDINTQYNFINKSDVHDITSQIVNKFDNNSLKTINDQYFDEFPINLMELVNASTEYKNHGYGLKTSSIFKLAKR